MKTRLFVLILWGTAFCLNGQNPDTTTNVNQNTASLLMAQSGKLSLGGYGEVHYNQPLQQGIKQAGVLDVHRIVMFLGYNFSRETQFVSEIEYEYTNELWVEQAYLQQKINNFISFRAGLLLIPMGIINEYHEPTTFNGVERPLIDNRIAPSTWREVGAGFTGTILPWSLKYQAYVINGINGYDSKGILNADKGLRDGRQKGSKSYMTSPNLAGRIEYFGIRNLNIGISGFGGKSQSRLMHKLHRDSAHLIARADSSVVGIAMFGADARYELKGLEIRGQYYYTAISNTTQYNQFTGIREKSNALGSGMTGYYIEAGYDVLRHCKRTHHGMVPFVRYEYFNTRQKAEGLNAPDPDYAYTMITTGVTYKLTTGAVLKADMQWLSPRSSSDWTKVFNAGIGVMF